MICPKCGNESDGKFCGKCGAPMPEENVTATGNAENSTGDENVFVQFEKNDEEQQGIAEKSPAIPLWVFFAAAAIVVLLIVGFTIKGIVRGTSKRPINKIEKLVNKGETDVDDYVKSLTPGFVNSAYKKLKKIAVNSSDDAEDFFDELSDDLEDFYDDYEPELEIEITDKERIKHSEVGDIEEMYRGFGEMLVGAIDVGEGFLGEDFLEQVFESDELEDLFDKYDIDLDEKDEKKVLKIVKNFAEDLSKVDITKGYSCDLEFSLEVNGYDADIELEDVNIILVDGKWVIDPVSLAESYAAKTLGVDPDKLDLDKILSYYFKGAYYSNYYDDYDYDDYNIEDFDISDWY